MVQFFINQICPAIRGDFRRFKSIYVSQIPIPTATELEKQVIEILVNYVLYLTAALKDIPSQGEALRESSMDKLMNSYFEQIIDALVTELYLPEELHNHDRYFMRYVLTENLPDLDQIKGDKMVGLREIFEKLFDKDHPLRVGIFFLDSVPAVRVIRGLK